MMRRHWVTLTAAALLLGAALALVAVWTATRGGRAYLFTRPT